MKNIYLPILSALADPILGRKWRGKGLTPVRVKLFSITLFMVFFSAQIFAQQIYINEFMASNSSTIADGADYDDWVELYNAGGSSVDIGGMYLSDNLAEPTLWQIPTGSSSVTTIPAGGYLLLWFDKETAQGPLHVDAKLGSGGEDIVLTASNGTTIIDSYTYGPQISDISEGRVGDGNSNWDFFGEPTPDASNDTDPGAPFADTPTVNIQGGFYSGSVTVSVSGSGDLRYTTDGSDPTQSDPLYSSSLTFNSNTPLRVRAFDPPALPSTIMTQTYLFNMDHDFAVIAYTIDPVTMFDPNTGMYTQFLEDIEVPVNVEFFEPDGTLGFNMILESEIQGTASASNNQKSLALKAKSSLGSSTIPYEVYPDSDISEYRSLTLRNSGQDWNLTMFRDAMASSLIDDLSDVEGTIVPPDADVGDFRPGVVYINGEYWGIHNVRERLDKRYLKVHYNLDDNEIDFLENDNEAKEGDFVEWEILETFLENNSVTSQANYDFVDSKVDMSNYIDQLVFMMYIDNQDWPGNNNIYFRERVNDAEWRWMVKDLDFSFGLFVPGQPWNSGFSNYNTLDRMSTDNSFNWPAPAWSTLMYRRLIQNDEWRERFINRFADQLNVLFLEDRVTGRIDDFKADYADEIVDHADRWFGGFLQWDSHVQKMRSFAETRTTNVRNHIISEYSDISGTSTITINLNPSNRGEVELSTITIDQPDNGWSGLYFRGNDVPVRAYPDRGYILNNWSGSLSGDNPNESINLNGNKNITANFIKGSTSTQPIVINEINYNSPDNAESGDWVELHNPNNNSVNIEGWYFEDEGGDFFGIPGGTTIPAGGYLILVEDEDEFNAIYPGVTNYIGEFGLGERGFGLSGGGEMITLKNANGVLIDEVDYDDNSPWPNAADGDGPTLQLIDPGLNNALASSWQAIAATPAALNGTNNGQNQSINFPSISDKETTDGPFNISATATSGLAVNFTILSGPATISGNTITLTGATGTVTVQANQGGNGTWNPAPSVNRSFDVTDDNTGGGCNVTYTTTNNSVTISGLTAPHINVKLFGPNWNTVFNCLDNCNNPQTISGLVSGTHHLDVQLYDANWQPICTVVEDIEIGGGGCTDNDNDGVCAADDCDDNNASIPTTPGTSCNDGNSNTTNDVILADGCTCQGTQVGGDPCDDVTISTSGNTISVTGLNTPISQVQIFNPDWTSAFSCSGNCNTSEIISGLAEGTYYVKVRLYNASWGFVCDIEEYIDVNGEGCTDNDNDGVCAPQDCDDNDASIPTNPGTSCNDGNSNTTNDVIQGDGCTCAGTPVGNGTDVGCGVSYTSTSNSTTITGLTGGHVIMKLFSPSWSTVYDCFDDCPDPLLITGLSDGTYHISVDIYTASWQPVCGLLEDLVIGSGSPLVANESADILFFNAMKDGRNVSLNWVTNTSYKTTSFEVERSIDGEVFEQIDALGSLGESNTELLYQTEDANPKFGANYYRLKQTFEDGTVEYSALKKVSFHLNLEEVVVFPNPANDNLYIDLNAYEGMAAELTIYNQLGKQLDILQVESLTQEAIHFDISEYQSGMYFISVEVNDQQRKSFRFVKAKQ